MRQIIKQVFDILFSLMAIIVLLPVFAVIVIAIRLTSKGPEKTADRSSFTNFGL